MKTKIFSFVKCPETSMIASVRIARFVSDTLGIDIVTDETIADEALDTLIVVNGAYAFCKFLEPLGQAIFSAKRVVWVQNDYTIIPPKPDAKAQSPFRKAFVDRREKGKMDTEYWTTCEDWAKLPGSRYVNWNCLTFREDTHQAKKRGTDLMYYGSFRDGSGKSSRKVYFDRYFASPRVPVTVSSPDKKFAETYKSESVTHVGKIEGSLHEELARHGAGLYIEDRMSHERYHSPANRFYEMLSAGLPMIFQPECGTMLRRAGYNPEPYAASNSMAVERVMSVALKKWGAEQRDAWWQKAAEEKRALPNELIKAWKGKK